MQLVEELSEEPILERVERQVAASHALQGLAEVHGFPYRHHVLRWYLWLGEMNIRKSADELRTYFNSHVQPRIDSHEYTVEASYIGQPDERNRQAVGTLSFMWLVVDPVAERTVAGCHQYRYLVDETRLDPKWILVGSDRWVLER